jgi:hypothetical protein
MRAKPIEPQRFAQDFWQGIAASSLDADVLGSNGVI